MPVVRPGRRAPGSAQFLLDDALKQYEGLFGQPAWWWGPWDYLGGPVVAMVVEGPEDTWEVVRSMMGATNPRTAAPGTIRGDLGILFTENLVHGSDSLASSEREIGIFFPNL